MTKINFKKICVANSFLGIFGNVREHLYLKVAVDELFLYAKDHATH